ncbi:hypothetical protein HAX54_014555, partial [Datura stramonium]|nr:hypothetical protein [Datura stramonium]
TGRLGWWMVMYSPQEPFSRCKTLPFVRGIMSEYKMCEKLSHSSGNVVAEYLCVMPKLCVEIRSYKDIFI